MTLKTTKKQLKMFELNFVGFLYPDHELLRAAKLIDWDQLHYNLSVHYSILGRSGKPIRLMVGLHILKHLYNCSDEQAVEELHENVYWQSFCGFTTFQRGKIIDATSLVKFRNRIGVEGMQEIETALLKGWQQIGLVKTRRVVVDTIAQPKNIAYPTDADLLHRIREKIANKVRKVRQSAGLRKSIRSFTRVSKKVLLNVKKFYHKQPDKRTSDLMGQLFSITRSPFKLPKLGQQSAYICATKTQKKY